MKANDVERLRQLGDLRDNGVLTDEEFAAQKAVLMGDGAAPSNGGRRRLAVLAALAGLLVAGAGVSGYFYGQSTRDEDAARDRGYDSGVFVTKAEYTPGSDRYQRIYDKGYALGKSSGKAAGLAEGKIAGREAGYESGTKDGAESAFEGYEGGWEVGSWYLIKVGTGQEAGTSAKYSIPTRVGPMKSSLVYLLCDGGICTRPQPGE